MAKFLEVVKSLSNISFLFLLIISLILLYAQTTSTLGIFGKDAAKWSGYFTTYLVIFALTLIAGLIFAPDEIKNLAKAKYWKSFVLRFIPVSLVSIVILVLIKGFIRGPGSINLLSAISNLPIIVIIFYALVVAQIEEILFGGVIYTIADKKFGWKSAYFISILLFVLWHFSKAGGSWLILITYIPLRIIFNYVRNNGFPILGDFIPLYFGPTPETQQANAGLHFSWDLFVIGFVGGA